MNDRVLRILMLVALAVCAASTQVAASSATLNWENQVGTTLTTGYQGCRAIAVDQTTGDVYVMFQNSIIKLDTNGVVLATIPPVIGGATIISSTNSAQALAVDPLTGYLYLDNVSADANGGVLVVDATTATPVYKGRVVDGWGNNGKLGVAFSQDGMKLYVTSSGIVKELIRTNPDGSVPDADYTDDVFDFNLGGTLDYTSTSGVLSYKRQGLGSAYTCAVDAEGYIYVTDYATDRALKVFAPGANTQAAYEFQTPTNRSLGCGIDANGFFVTADIAYNAAQAAQQDKYVRFYKNGIPFFAFDAMTGRNTKMFQRLEVDRVRNKVLVAGQAPYSGSNATYVQCWTTSVDAPAMGTFTGRAVQDSDGTTAVPLDYVSFQCPYQMPNYYRSCNYGVAFYTSGNTDGTYSFQLPAAGPTGGLFEITKYSVRAQGAGFIQGGRSHYDLPAGDAVSIPDIRLLAADSPYIRIVLGEHNVEQGISTSEQSWSQTSPAPVTCTTVDNQAGKECRKLGTSSKDSVMNFRTDEQYFARASKTPLWWEYDILDKGYDRFDAQIDTQAVATCYTSNVLKRNTGAWKQVRRSRPDFWAGNRIANMCDMSLVSCYMDAPTYMPAGPDWIASITMYRNEPVDFYAPLATVADAKKFRVGQSYGSPSNNSKFAGGEPVKLTGKKVTLGTMTETGSTDAFFYIQDGNVTDGSCAGIRVYSSDVGVLPGDTVDVQGAIIGVGSNEELSIRCMGANGVVVTESFGTPLEPVLIAKGKDLVGSHFYQTHSDGVKSYPWTSEWGLYGPGATKPLMSFGPNNTGLFVKITGKVTYVGSDIAGVPFAYVDDGSKVRGENPGGTPAQPDRVGVRLVGLALGGIEVGSQVAVTGVVSTYLYDPPTTGNDWWKVPMIYVSDCRTY